VRTPARAIAVVVLATLGLVGCSDDDGSLTVADPGSTLPGGSTTTAPTGEAKRLADLVLIASDLPDGWSGTTPDGSDAAAAEELAACAGASGKAATAAEFSGQDFAKDSDQISSEALLVKDDAAYAKDVAAVKSDRFITCLKEQVTKEVQPSLAGRTLSIDVADLAVPRHGDVSLGRRLTVTVQGGGDTLKLFADFVVLGKKRIELSASFLGVGRPIDDALRTSLIGKLGARLDAAPAS
jgi:hypothetical protein